MSRIYTDYINKTAITIPDKFIDVKTGESHTVSAKMQEQIDYHANNSTLMHLVFSALHSYLHPKQMYDRGTKEILFELTEIKKMMQQGFIPKHHPNHLYSSQPQHVAPVDLDIKEIEDVLDAFGG